MPRARGLARCMSFSGICALTLLAVSACAVAAVLFITTPGVLTGAGYPKRLHCITNATRSICTVDIGDTVKIECPVTSSCICSWERNGQSVCSGSVCTLTDIEVDDLGLYSCGVQELILIPGHEVGSQSKLAILLLSLLPVVVITACMSCCLCTNNTRDLLGKCLPSSQRWPKLRALPIALCDCAVVLTLVITGALLVTVVTPHFSNDILCALDYSTTVSTCKPCNGDNVHLHCPVNTSHWEKDNRTICEHSNCTLSRVSKDDLGFYQCVDYGIVLAVATGDCKGNSVVIGWALISLAVLLTPPLLILLIQSLRHERVNTWDFNDGNGHLQSTAAYSRLQTVESDTQPSVYRSHASPHMHTRSRQPTALMIGNTTQSVPALPPPNSATQNMQAVPQPTATTRNIAALQPSNRTTQNVPVLPPRAQSSATQSILTSAQPNATTAAATTPITTTRHVSASLDHLHTLQDCNSEVRSYYNEENDFRLVIPEGAIPVGDSITIDIGVALFGPFQYPPNIRPVSPVFWVSVRGHQNYRFLKPLRVTIEHCLNLSGCDDAEIVDVGLQFMKACPAPNTSGKYVFLSAAEDQDFLTQSFHGSLMDRFTAVCICASATPDTVRQTAYQLSVVHPTPVRANGTCHTVHFITSFSLKYCISKLKEHYPSELFSFLSKRFMFDCAQNEKALSMDYTAPATTNWFIDPNTATKINVADIEYWDRDSDLMQVLVVHGEYPPRFAVDVSGSGMTDESHAHFVFFGATEELVYKLPLLPE